METLSEYSSPDKWKVKFFDLLEENEVLEKSHKNKEDLLCKTVSRISHATKGFNKKLDPYLQRIQEQVSKRVSTEQLAPELESFSKAVMDMEQEEDVGGFNPELLFDFLLYYHPEFENDVISIKDGFKENIPNKKKLFKEIVVLLNTLSSTADSSKINSIDFDTVRRNLHNILDATEIPSKFESQVKDLKETLESNISPTIILDETVELLFEIKKDIQTEQQDITYFLAQVTDQLADLSIKASGTYSASKNSDTKRNLLDQSVSSQFIELQQHSESATELAPLQQLIHSRLNNISQQIQNHLVQEQLERKETQQELEDLSQKISLMENESRLLKDKLVIAHEKSTHDPLTGLPNRRAYENHLTKEISRWKRYKTPLSIIIWDIDHFKKINDSYGHKAGDKTLCLIATLLTKYCRETDFVSRFGGEEFTMLLSNTDAQAALLAANKIRKIIEKTAFNSNGDKISITLSCGVAQFDGDDTGKIAFERADKALYNAKSNGRNQCVIS